MRSDSFNRINKTASLWEQRYWKHGFVSNGQILFISNPLSMNLIEIKSNYARTTSFIIYLNNFNKKLDRYRYFFFFWKTFRNVKQYFLCNNKIRIDWNFQEDGVCKITRFFSRIIRTFFFCTILDKDTTFQEFNIFRLSIRKMYWSISTQYK